MADDAPTEGVTVPAREPSIAGQRGLAFALDLALISALGGAATIVLSVLPGVALTLIRGVIAFGVWSSSAWVKDGRTPGMRMMGLEIRDASGARASRAAHIKRAAFLTLVYSLFVLELLDALTRVGLSHRLWPVQFGVAFGYAGFAVLELVAGGNTWLLHDRWSGAGVWRVGREHVPPILPGAAAIRQALILMAIATLPALVLSNLKVKEQGFTSSSTFRPKCIPKDLAQVLENRLETENGLRAKVGFGQERVWPSNSARVTWLVMNLQVPSGTFSMDAASLKQVTRFAGGVIDQLITEINQRHLDVHEFDGIKLNITSPMSPTFTEKVKFKRPAGSRPSAPGDST